MKDTSQMFTAKEIEAFNYGDCWLLALAIHQITDWKIVGVGVKGQESRGGYRDWCHIAVQTPNNKILDINGLHTKDEVIRKWTLAMWKALKAPVQIELFSSPNPEYSKAIIFGQRPRYKFSKKHVDDIALTLVKYYKRQCYKDLWESVPRLKKKSS